MNASSQIWSIAAIGVIFALTCFAQDDECKDRNFCKNWEEFCTDESVKEWCPKMCGECTVTPRSILIPCTDGYTQCSGWKSYCESNDWTQKNCKKTCDLCGDKGWSECTKTCGNGTRYKKECEESGNCSFVFQPCANNKCPEETSCSSPQEQRYGVPHACCEGEVMPLESRCGQPFLSSKVIGGKNAKRKEWPWMVAIAMTEGQFCAAVVIGKNHLLSAAHCFADTPDNLYDTSQWKLYSGILQLSNTSEATILKIKNVTVHPKYQFPANDIAIVELEKPLKFSPTIQPICLPGGEVTPQDGTCYVTGWGISENSGGGTTDHLQKAALQNLDRRICRNAYDYLYPVEHMKSYLSADEGYLCAGSLHEKLDSCGGDSGGPFVCQRCSSCTWYLAGIVSFGSLECGKIGTPGVYTEVRPHEDWIQQVTGISHSNRTCSRKVGH